MQGVEAAARRELWTVLEVTPDLVSGTVLAWGLRPPGHDLWSEMMRQRAHLGTVTHLTLQELRGPAAGVQLAEPGSLMSVCENPQVLQAAARAGAPSPLLCTSGNPASVGWQIVRELLGSSVRLRYHGDFDWPGVTIAGRLYANGVVPWRMQADDYFSAVAMLPADSRLGLEGVPVATPWDPRLAAAMHEQQVAVQESLLEVLLPDSHKH